MSTDTKPKRVLTPRHTVSTEAPRPPRVCFLLPEDARGQLKRAVDIPEPVQRLAAIDLATARIRKKYPHLYRQIRNC